MKNNTLIRSIVGAVLTCVMALSSADAGLVVLSDDFSSSTVNTNGLTFSDLSSSGVVGSGTWDAVGGTNWTVAGGSLTNSGGGTNAQNEGAFARLVDIRSFTDTSVDQLTLSVDFTTADASENLYVHIRGFILGSDPAGNLSMVNGGATNGNAWNNAFGHSDWTIYNLNSGQLNNHFSNFSSASWAQRLTDGVAGTHNFSQTYDMSSYAAAANNIAAFDYVGIYITRNHIGTSPSVSIDSISLVAAVPEPSSVAVLGIGIAAVLFRRKRKPNRS